MFRNLNEVPPSYDWLTYEYIDSEAKKKLDKTKGRLSGDEMEKETKLYVECINHDLNCLKTINIEIDKFFIDCEYINFFVQIYMQWSKYDGCNSSS